MKGLLRGLNRATLECHGRLCRGFIGDDQDAISIAILTHSVQECFIAQNPPNGGLSESLNDTTTKSTYWYFTTTPPGPMTKVARQFLPCIDILHGRCRF
jgi:hypothetical protein